MNDQDYKMIEMALTMIKTLAPEEHTAILEFCKNLGHAATTESKGIPKYYSKPDVAEKLSVCTKTVSRWIKSGKLKEEYFDGIPRISEIALQEFKDTYSDARQNYTYAIAKAKNELKRAS